MRLFTYNNLLIIVLLVVTAIGVWRFSVKSKEDAEKRENNTVLVSRKTEKDKVSKKPRTRIKFKSEDSSSKLVLEKPVINLDEIEQMKLDKELAKVLVDLTAMLDENDFHGVLRMVMRMNELEAGKNGKKITIPISIKKFTMDALAWFGSKGMPELVGFLGDESPEVVEYSYEKFEEMLQDIDLSDYEVSSILKMMVQVVNDAEILDSFFMEMNNMRNSVKADTALSIYNSGNEAAISVLEENLSFIFADADYDVLTKEDLLNYKDDPNNADGEDDDEMYGKPPQTLEKNN